MVWPFKKSKEMIDYTYLVKRGLLKLPKQTEEFKQVQSPISTDSGALGFLSSMADSSASSNDSFGHLQEPGMKNKIEDFEFKLDSLMRRVDSMIDRLDLVEKKVDRNGRAGM